MYIKKVSSPFIIDQELNELRRDKEALERQFKDVKVEYFHMYSLQEVTCNLDLRKNLCNFIGNILNLFCRDLEQKVLVLVPHGRCDMLERN